MTKIKSDQKKAAKVKAINRKNVIFKQDRRIIRFL